jgi:hypothetical protein
MAGGEATSARVPGVIHPALLVPKAIPAGSAVLDEAIALFNDAFVITHQSAR